MHRDRHSVSHSALLAPSLFDPVSYRGSPLVATGTGTQRTSGHAV